MTSTNHASLDLHLEGTSSSAAIRSRFLYIPVELGVVRRACVESAPQKNDPQLRPVRLQPDDLALTFEDFSLAADQKPR